MVYCCHLLLRKLRTLVEQEASRKRIAISLYSWMHVVTASQESLTKAQGDHITFLITKGIERLITELIVGSTTKRHWNEGQHKTFVTLAASWIRYRVRSVIFFMIQTSIVRVTCCVDCITGFRAIVRSSHIVTSALVGSSAVLAVSKEAGKRLVRHRPVKEELDGLGTSTTMILAGPIRRGTAPKGRRNERKEEEDGLHAALITFRRFVIMISQRCAGESVSQSQRP
jgi:hypothetical protein